MTAPNTAPNPNQPPQIDPLVNPERFDQDPAHYDAMLRVAEMVHDGETAQLREEAYNDPETFSTLLDVAFDASASENVDPAELTAVRDTIDTPIHRVSAPANEAPDDLVDHWKYLREGVKREPLIIDQKTGKNKNPRAGFRTPSAGDRDPGVRAQIDKHLQQIEAQASYLSTIHFQKREIRAQAEATSRKLLNEAIAGLDGLIAENHDYGYVVQDFFATKRELMGKAQKDRAKIDSKLVETEGLYSDVQAIVRLEDARAVITDAETETLK